jgi:hypothetical protein
MRLLPSFCAAIVCLSVSASAQPKPYSLPSHKGAMVLDLNGFHVTQQSAKPDGREIGVRAHDAEHTELLAFLFLTPDKKSQTAASCMAQDIAEGERSRYAEAESAGHGYKPMGERTADVSQWIRGGVSVCRKRRSVSRHPGVRG